MSIKIKKRLLKNKMKHPSKELIDKVLIGNASEQEAEMIARWFESSEGQLYLEKNMDAFYQQIQPGFEEIYIDHPIPSEKIYHKIEKTLVSKKRYKLWLQVAAVLLPFVILSGFIFSISRNYSVFGAPSYTEIYVPKGERMNITLPDGTDVHLNADTKFRYPKKFRFLNRDVELLSGEAYFTVKKDKKRPFYVKLSDATVEVLGTSFDLNAYENNEQIIVTLDEGKIQLRSSNNLTYQLEPQQQLLYNKTTKTAETFKIENSGSYSDWKKNIISFQNTCVADVIRTLNRWFDVEFEVLKPEVYDYSFTLVSENEPLDTILNDLEKISPLKFKKSEDKIKVDIR